MTKLLEKCEQAIIDACTKTGNRDFFYIAPDNDGRGLHPLYYLLCEPLSKRQARRYRIRAQLKLFGYNKDGSKIVRNKNNESNESMDNNNNNNNNNAQAIPPPNPPSQQNNSNRVESRDKDGSKIVSNKNKESDESINNNNAQAIPPATNLPRQQNENDKNNLWLLAEAAAGCSSEVTDN